MSAMLTKDLESVAPGEADTLLAQEASRRLAAYLAPKQEPSLAVVLEGERPEAPLVLPVAALRLLCNILTEMAEGNAVTVIPHPRGADDATSSRPAERVQALPHQLIGAGQDSPS